VVSYTVVSRVPTPTAQELQAIPPLYPPDIRERYLQLPETVPQRVVDLAWEVVDGADSVYERARLLERYLRAYPYSLQVARPPEDRDVVDYFLFDAREGYCDYYATAFVVMARSAGLPSRLATGYAGGEVDPATGERVVVEANAHSWPEVYFPGWGWVRFEPTAGRDEDQPSLQATEAATDGRRPGLGPVPRWLRVGGTVLVGALLLGSVAWIGWRTYRRREEAALTDLPQTWRRIVAIGRQLDVPRRTGQTVLAYTTAISEALAERAAAAHWGETRWKTLAAEARGLLQAFAQAYSHYLYGGGSPSEETSWARTWRLIARLRWVPLDRAIIRLVWPRSASRSSR
jgi:hypothetical protein